MCLDIKKNKLLGSHLGNMSKQQPVDVFQRVNVLLVIETTN